CAKLDPGPAESPDSQAGRSGPELSSERRRTEAGIALPASRPRLTASSGAETRLYPGYCWPKCPTYLRSGSARTCRRILVRFASGWGENNPKCEEMGECPLAA